MSGRDESTVRTSEERPHSDMISSPSVGVSTSAAKGPGFARAAGAREQADGQPLELGGALCGRPRQDRLSFASAGTMELLKTLGAQQGSKWPDRERASAKAEHDDEIDAISQPHQNELDVTEPVGGEGFGLRSAEEDILAALHANTVDNGLDGRSDAPAKESGGKPSLKLIQSSVQKYMSKLKADSLNFSPAEAKSAALRGSLDCLTITILSQEMELNFVKCLCKESQKMDRHPEYDLVALFNLKASSQLDLKPGSKVTICTPFTELSLASSPGDPTKSQKVIICTHFAFNV